MSVRVHIEDTLIIRLANLKVLSLAWSKQWPHKPSIVSSNLTVPIINVVPNTDTGQLKCYASRHIRNNHSKGTRQIATNSSPR
jgi:hypothetical protein